MLAKEWPANALSRRQRAPNQPCEPPSASLANRPARTLPAPETLPTKREARVIVEERGAKKLIVPLMIALLFAVTLGFALSRAR